MIPNPLMLIAALGSTPAAANPARVFAPGTISAGSSDAALTFSRDGREAYFERSNGESYAIMRSRLTAKGWSKPKVASFSGRWLDLELAMSVDGKSLVFSSNRPARSGGKPIDGFYSGKVQVAKGGALWRVDRAGARWSKPLRLPASVNISTSIYEPSLAANGDLYFQSADPDGKGFHLYVARTDGKDYAKAERIELHGPKGSSDMDPAIARDGSYLVFASDRDPPDHHLFIAFRSKAGWSDPRPLGPNVNAGGVGDPRLDEGHHRLYFASRKLAPPTGDVPADLEAAAKWNNGLSNIWFVAFDPAKWRD